MTTFLIGAKSQASAQVAVAEVTLRRISERRSAIADANGIATIEIPGIEFTSFQQFNVYESLKVFSDSSDISTFTMYEGEEEPQYFLGGTDRGNLNEWTENPPLYTNEKVIFQWTGASVGALCYLRIQMSQVIMIPVKV
jgi:hypothetical protein